MGRWSASVAVLLLAGCGEGGGGDDDPAADLGVAPDAAVAVDLGAPDAVPPDLGAPDAAADGAPSDAAVEPDAAPPPDPGPVNAPDEALDAVNAFIGTGGLAGGFSALTPAAQLPNGLVKLGPDSTRGSAHPWFLFGGYHFDYPDVRGFSHLHFVGTGVADYGNLRVLPLATIEGDTPDERWAPMDKSSERASPGRYQVRLTDPDVQVDLTATLRGGLHRYTFADAGPRYLAFDVAASVFGDAQAVIVDAAPGLLEGHVVYKGAYTGRTRPFTLHFSATVDPPAAAVHVWNGEGLQVDTTHAEGTSRGGAILEFADVAGTPITMRVGVSMTDLEGARANREQELEGRDFDTVAAAARDAWRDKLRRVRVAGGTPDDRVIFFTAMYNAYRMPSRLDDVDGRYRGLDGEVHSIDGFAYYTDLSLWDTFRTLHPWLALTDHDLQRDCLQSLMAMGRDGGYIPKWPAAISYTNGMLGTSADVVFADSALKGVEGVDYGAAFAELKTTADAPTEAGHPYSGRRGIESYLRLGYVPVSHAGASVSTTLEFAYDDGALANLAGHLGLADDEARYRQRSFNWRNHFDPETKFLRARHEDGTWDELGDPARGFDDHEYREGTAWNWRMYAPHDPEGLRDAHGGAEGFGAILEEMFSRSGLGKEGPIRTTLPDPYYWHGNEVDLHVPFLFAFTDRPSRQDHWVREIQTRLYWNEADGIPGNDDGGALSTWFTFSAIGAFPLAGTDRYIVSTPLFPRVEVDTPDGTVLKIEAPGADHERRYVHALTRDGAPVAGRELKHADLLGGPTFHFTMSRTSP